MRRVLFLLICAVCFSPLLRAQKLKDDISCYSDRKDNAPHKKKLWEGYEISLGPSRDPEAVEEKCTAAIYNSTGRVVFRTSGFNVVFDEEQTGKDFDGDGKPEVVFRTDTGGGMHCCWGYLVYSLSPKPHKLFEIAKGQVNPELEIDLPLITRAVRYVGQVHALPAMDDDTGWFYDMLRVVLEIARPNTGVEEDNKEFLRDMLQGIEQSLSD